MKKIILIGILCSTAVLATPTDDLLEAVSSDNISAVKAAINAKADLNGRHAEYGYSALTRACAMGQEEIIKLLIKAKVDVKLADKNGDTPLCKASQQGHAAVVKLLIKAKAHVNAKPDFGNSLLDCATGEGADEVIKLLKAAGVK